MVHLKLKIDFLVTRTTLFCDLNGHFDDFSKILATSETKEKLKREDCNKMRAAIMRYTLG